jgi:hypothetical protein
LIWNLEIGTSQIYRGIGNLSGDLKSRESEIRGIPDSPIDSRFRDNSRFPIDFRFPDRFQIARFQISDFRSDYRFPDFTFQMTPPFT